MEPAGLWAGGSGGGRIVTRPGQGACPFLGEVWPGLWVFTLGEMWVGVERRGPASPAQIVSQLGWGASWLPGQSGPSGPLPSPLPGSCCSSRPCGSGAWTPTFPTPIAATQAPIHPHLSRRDPGSGVLAPPRADFPPARASLRWSPMPPSQRSRTFSLRAVSPGPSHTASCSPSGQGPLGGTPPGSLSPQGLQRCP